MKTPTLRSWMPVVIFLMAIFSIAPANLFAQTAGVCKCADKDDLLNQLNRANAAIDKIGEYLKTVKPGEMANEIPPTSNPTKLTNATLILNAVIAKMESVTNTQAQNLSVTVNTITCEAKSAGGTPCLQSIADFYGAVRKNQCEAEKRRNKLGENDDIMNFMRLDTFLLNLSEAYGLMVQEILKRLNALPKSCRFDSWLGTIRYSFFRKDHRDQDRPEANETHSFDDLTTIDGVVRLNGHFSWEYPSSWEAGGKYVEKKHSSGMRPCVGGLKQEGDKHKYTTDYIFTWDKKGSKVRDTEVKFGELFETNKIPIQFRIPEITLTTNGYSKSSYQSDCPKPNGDFDGPQEPWNITMPLDSQLINFNGNYFPGNPEKLSGSETLESGASTVIVTYKLYKFKP